MNYNTYNIKAHNIVWFKVPFVESGKSFWRRLFFDFKKWIKFLLHFNYRFDIIPLLNDVVFIIGTDNNQKALEPIYSKMDPLTYSIIDTRQRNPFYPLEKYRHYSMLYLVNLLFSYCFSTRNEKRRIANNYDEFMPTIGFMKCTEDIFTCNPNIKLVVMANDHSSIERSFVCLAPRYGIKTLYTQHCSIAYHFPALQFSYSFLDGEETYEKYKTIGNLKGTVYISGNPRFDHLIQYKRYNKESDIIGIAINLMDNEDEVKHLCEDLIALGYKLCIRPHPRQTLSYYDWYVEKGMDISNPKTESSFEFSARMRVIIAGETGLHFDAAMMEKPSICYIFDGKPAIDWYSYIKNGLIPYAKNEDELKAYLPKLMNNSSLNKGILRWYNAAYQTEQDGHIGEQIKGFIISVLKNKQSEFDALYGYVTEYADENFTKKIYKRNESYPFQIV